LAFLPPEEQRGLLKTLGESGVCDLSVGEAKELRRQLDAERRRLAEAQSRIRDLEERVAELQADSEDVEALFSELERLREENERLKSQAAEAVERAVERVVYRPDPEQEAELERLRGEVADLRERLSRLSDRRGAEAQVAELDRLIQVKQAQLERLEAERATLDRELQGRRHAAALLRALDSLLIPLERRKEEVAELLRTCEIEANVRSRLWGYAELLRWYADRLEEAGRTVTVVDVRVLETG
jgi:ParB family chromosome partitioning protein